MNAVSMTTKALRDILQRMRERDLGFCVLVARDIIGVGGQVFIAAHTELTEHHLTWLEQRNPAPNAPTHVDIVFSENHSAAALADQLDLDAEAPEKAGERRQRATAHSRAVGERAEAVARQARQVYQIIGDAVFSPGALRNRKVQASLCDLDERLQHFDRAVRAALDDYLAGNTLIMDLIAQYDPGVRAVIHGLNVAVFATELASQVLLKGEDTPDLEAVKRELAEVFLGGFMHDCGLWDENLAGAENHEMAGARLAWHLPELRGFAPALVKILLFHSDILPLAAKPVLVEFVVHADDAERLRFEREFFASVREAKKAIAARTKKGAAQGSVLDEEDLRRVLPVAMAEYCTTQTEGFDALTRAEVVDRLTRHGRDGLFVQYLIALCNSQVEVIAPRRAYVQLSGHIVAPVRDSNDNLERRELALEGFAGGSILHSNDAYSPHLIVLFCSNAAGQQQKLAYVAAHDGTLWGRRADVGQRFYIAAGRHRDTLSFRVTGFMSETAYDNILGEYESALKMQMQM